MKLTAEFPWFRSLLLLLLAVILFWPTLVQMESVWRHSETFMHCYFIVPMAIYLGWTQRHSLQGLTVTPALLPALLLLPVLGLWLSAYAIDVGFVSHVSQVVAFQLLLWHLLGHQIARKIRFPLLFLIFTAPFGESLTPVLQEMTADMGVALLRMADVPVYREGLYLHTPTSVFEVAVACSGLNFLISSAVIALLFAFLSFRTFYKQVVFVVFVLVLAILANGLRAFLLMFIGEKTNMAWGFGDDHYYYGWAVFALTMLLSFRVGERFADQAAPSCDKQPGPSSSVNSTLVNSTADNSEPQPQLSGSTSAQPTPAKSVWFSGMVAMVMLAAFYPLRFMLPQTVAPETPTAVFSLDLSGDNGLTIDSQKLTARPVNPLGSTFNDGIRRSAIQSSTGTLLFAADYAIRQRSGDLITWHNWLYDQKHWTITDRETVGPLTDSKQWLQLINAQGRSYTLVYWYQLGDVRSANKVVIKLLQLKAILLHEPVAMGVRMLAVPQLDFQTGKPLLQRYQTQMAPWTVAPKPLEPDL